MKIYFVRHGETDMNARNMFYGWYDADINEKGIAQAEELRAAFETIHIDAIYSSDLKRAYHTAEIIANGREIQPVPEIRELYYGDWENRTWEEMSEADLEEWHGWLTDWVDRRMPNGDPDDISGCRLPVETTCRKHAPGRYGWDSPALPFLLSFLP